MSNDPSVAADAVSLLVTFLVTWWPMLVVIALMIIFMRRFMPRRGELRSSQYLALHLEEQKRHNEALEKILDRIVPASARNDITASSTNQQ
jgi:ATP-dependent Zn protease